jgi:hypothetical protein
LCGEAEDWEHMLDLMICPGDLLFSQDFSHMCAAYACIVILLPVRLPEWNYTAQRYRAQLHAPNCCGLWLIYVLEWSDEFQKPRTAMKVFWVDSGSGRLLLLGDADESRDSEQSAVELWQSPSWLRARLRTDLVAKAVYNMSSPWSADDQPNHLEERVPVTNLFQDSRRRDPRSAFTCVIIRFWQIYLVLLARFVGGESPQSMVSKWMPLEADCACIQELRIVLNTTGWASIQYIPILKRPIMGVFQQANAFTVPLLDVNSPKPDMILKNEICDLFSEEEAVVADIPSDDDDSLADLLRTRGRLSSHRRSKQSVSGATIGKANGLTCFSI